MPALTTAADLRRWFDTQAPRAPGGAADPWLDAAAALRHAALEVAGVAALSDSAAFQTRGRGPAVAGVALAPLVGGGIRADVALVVGSEAVENAGLEPVSRFAGQAVRAAWDRLGDPSPFEVQIHVVDVDVRDRPHGRLRPAP